MARLTVHRPPTAAGFVAILLLTAPATTARRNQANARILHNRGCLDGFGSL